MIGQASGEAVWRGCEIEGRSEWRFELSKEHVAEALAALAGVDDLDLHEITTKNFVLPTLGPILESFLADLLDGRGFVLIRGVPVEGLPERRLKALYWGIGQYIGIPIPQNDAAEYLVHIRDQGLDFANPEVRGYQTSAKLDYHSDSSDVVGLLCVRPAKDGGISTLVSAAAVYNEAVRRRPDLVGVFEASWWWDRRKKDLSVSFFECRIFAVENNTLTSYYGRGHLESASRGPDVPALTAQQIEALDLLDEITNEPAFVLNMHFRPGDIQFLNNYKVWHARTDYVDWPEPDRKRDLYRLWLTVRGELDLPTDFAERGITNRSAAFDQRERPMFSWSDQDDPARNSVSGSRHITRAVTS